MTQRPGNQEAWRQQVQAFRSVTESLRSPFPGLLADLLAPEKLLDMAGEPPLVGFSPFGTLPRDLGDNGEQRPGEGSDRPARAAPGLAPPPRQPTAARPAAGLAGRASQSMAPLAVEGGTSRPVFSLRRISGPDGRAGRSGPGASPPTEQGQRASPGSGPPGHSRREEPIAQEIGNLAAGQPPRQGAGDPQPEGLPSRQQPAPLPEARPQAAPTSEAGALLTALAEEALRGTRVEGGTARGPRRGHDPGAPQGTGRASSAPWQLGLAEATRGRRWPGAAGLLESATEMMGRLAGELLAPGRPQSMSQPEAERLRTVGGEGRGQGTDNGTAEAAPARQGYALEPLPWKPLDGGPAQASAPMTEAPRAPLPDAETLAALVNQVLLEQARLHGVDLS